LHTSCTLEAHKLERSVDGGFPKMPTLFWPRKVCSTTCQGDTHSLLEKTRKLIEINFYANLNRARTQLKQS